MRLKTRARATAMAGLAVLSVAGATAAQARAPARAPSRLMVSGDEFSLMLSRGTVKRGPAVIQFVNRGEDPHDLRLARIGFSATRIVSAPEVPPGALVEVEARLSTGKYRLWCSLPGHRELGMRAVLRVRRAR
jgi:plastocyanin